MPWMGFPRILGLVVLVIQIDQLVFVEETVVLVVIEIIVIEIFIVRIEILDLVVVAREVEPEFVASR
jgi:hypothetical protein